MLIISLIALFFVFGALAAVAWSSQMRTSVILAGLAILFLPFGLLIGIGYLVPKALQACLNYLPLREYVS